MLRIFKEVNRSGPDKADVINTVRKKVDNKLHQFASYLTLKTKHLQPGRLALIISVVCIILSLSLAVQFFYSFNNSKAVRLQRVSAPHIKPSHSISVDEIVLLRIRSFHHYLDSLKSKDFLRYDSIMQARPGLMDSINLIEQFTGK